MKRPNLKRAFLSYNRQWFGNRLSTDIIVRWTNLDDMGDYADGEIRINRALARWKSAWRLTLLHEMAHVETDSEHASHGKRWLRVMHRLAKQGAFNKLW